MKKLSLLFIFCSVQYMQAQTAPAKSKISAEVLAGSGNYGVGASYAIDKITAVEGILSVNPGQQKYLLTALYEQFYKIRKSTNLKWYAGLGMHIGFVRHKEQYTRLDDATKTDGLQQTINVTQISRKLVAGADATLGLQYSVKNSPITVGIATKPYMDFINNSSQLLNYSIHVGYRF